MELGNSSTDLCSLYFHLLEQTDRVAFNLTATSNHSLGNCDYPEKDPAIVTSSIKIYTYTVPIILAIGLLGNLVSLRVFLSRNMRKLSASTYLAALSTSDIMALIFHVLVDWLRWGLPSLSSDNAIPQFLNTPGVCQVLFYFSYVSRFLSAWFIVTFTVERYIGVCHPLRRKDICGSRSAQKVVSSLVVIALVLMLYKPILTAARTMDSHSFKLRRCLPDPDHPMLVFTLDSIYGLSITIIPFVLISVLNALIIRKLLRRYHRHRQCHVVTEESIIRMEFTVILLVVSFVFIVLNLPFCVVWCKRFLMSRLSASEDVVDHFSQLEGVLLLTRIVFYVNYCVNFFLYSVTGAYFRHELKILVFYRSQRYSDYVKCSRVNSSPTTPQSWV